MTISDLRAYGATFLIFSDYMKPAVRISALSHIPSIWVYTHDSIGLGDTATSPFAWAVAMLGEQTNGRSVSNS